MNNLTSFLADQVIHIGALPPVFSGAPFLLKGVIMLDVSIYYKNGNRSYIDHVTEITDGDKIGFEITTDFGHSYYRCIEKSEIKEMRVKVYG